MFGNWKLEEWKSLFEILFYVVAIVSAFGAVITYWRNSAAERSRWLSALYEKFYERESLKQVRTQLDRNQENEEIQQLALQEKSEFTDYLNFFEYVVYLVESKQIRQKDMIALFGYYLECLKRHGRVRNYIGGPRNGYESLSKHFGLRT